MREDLRWWVSVWYVIKNSASFLIALFIILSSDVPLLKSDFSSRSELLASLWTFSELRRILIHEGIQCRQEVMNF